MRTLLRFLLDIWLFAFLLGVLLGCGLSQGSALQAPMKPADPNAKRIIGVGTFASRGKWEATPWARIEDAVIDLPVLVLIATDHSACITDGPTWATARVGELYACEAKWRWPRP
jgi:hypothetical protein